MNEKDIQSFSLATLIDVCGRRPGDICYDGCLIASRVNVQDEIDIDLFRYPTRRGGPRRLRHLHSRFRAQHSSGPSGGHQS